MTTPDGKRLKEWIRQLRLDASGEAGRMPSGDMYQLADWLDALLLSVGGEGEPQKIMVPGAEINQSEASHEQRPTAGNPVEREG